MGSLAATLVWSSATRTAAASTRRSDLISQVREAAPHKALTVSLCELLSVQPEWHEVIDVATGTTNADDIDLQIPIYYAGALSNVGRDDAALLVYKEALKSAKRDSELLWWARYRRAQTQLRLGSKARARADFARIYAENPHYSDVAQQLPAPRRRAVKSTPSRLRRPQNRESGRMLVLRCTAKLLGIGPPRNPVVPSSTVLGDWYAAPINIGARRYVLAISEHSRLPVLMAARDVKHLPIASPTPWPRYSGAWGSRPARSRARSTSRAVQLAKTNTALTSAPSTTSPTCCAGSCPTVRNLDLVQAALELSHTPVGPLRPLSFPDKVTRLLLAG